MIAPGSELSVARQAKLLGISRSSVYYRPRRESQEELDLLRRLDELFTENPVYGSRRVQQMLKREGVLVGRRRIRRLMRKLGRNWKRLHTAGIHYLWLIFTLTYAIRVVDPETRVEGVIGTALALGALGLRIAARRRQTAQPQTAAQTSTQTAA